MIRAKRALYRFARDLGDAAPDLLLLHLADHAAARGPRLERREWERHAGFVAWVLHMLNDGSDVASPPKLITGTDLMRELDLQPGQIVGRLLDAVREAQAEGEIANAAEAIEYARSKLDRLSGAAEGV